MEQKKGFLEDGGGFDRIWDGGVDALRRFKRSRYGLPVGLVLLVLAGAWLTLRYTVDDFSSKIKYRFDEIAVEHQLEAGVPEAAGISVEELTRLNSLVNSALSGLSRIVPEESYVERYEQLSWAESYEAEFDYFPFTGQEIELLDQCSAHSAEIYGFVWDFYVGKEMARFLLLSFGAWLVKTRKKLWLGYVSWFAGQLAATGLICAFGFIVKLGGEQMLDVIAGLLFTAEVWPLDLGVGLLACIFPTEVVLSIGTEIFHAVVGRMLLLTATIALGMFIFYAIAYVVKRITKKNKTEEST